MDSINLILALGTIFVGAASIITSVWAVKSSRKKRIRFEEVLISEVLRWHQECVNALAKIRVSQGEDHSKLQDELYALVTQGRFFFKNREYGDGNNSDEPEAYKGNRDITLDFLVYSHNIYSKNMQNRFIKELEHLQRLFTSRVYEFVHETETYLNDHVRFDDYYLQLGPGNEDNNGRLYGQLPFYNIRECLSEERLRGFIADNFKGKKEDANNIPFTMID